MPLNFNKLTTKSQEALQKAQDIAVNNSNQIIEPPHLFSAMLGENESILNSILIKLSADKEQLKNRTEELINALPKVSGSVAEQLSISRELNSVLEKAFSEASDMKDDYVSVEHLLIALVETKGNVSILLKSFNLTKKSILNILKVDFAVALSYGFPFLFKDLDISKVSKFHQ